MSLDDVETVFLAFAFIVPGFVAHATLALFLPRRAEAPQLTLIRFLTLSAVNYAVWSWLLYLVVTTSFFQERNALAAVAWVWVMLAAPILLGLALAEALKRPQLYGLLQRVGLRPIHVIPTAWDWRFDRMAKPHWVLVTLLDGSFVAGLFGTESFASSDPTERDIYIEQIYEISSTGTWSMASKGKGILVPAREIRHIEIYPVE
jgi:hypothetical protein